MSLPGAGNRVYLAFIAGDQLGEIKLQPRTKLLVFVNPSTAAREDAWTAITINPLPLTPVGWISMQLLRPKKTNPDDQISYVEFDLAAGKCSFDTDVDARKGLEDLPIHNFRIELVDSDKTTRQRLAALETIRISLLNSEETYQSWLPTLLGRTAVNPSCVDLYEKVGAPSPPPHDLFVR
jgi:hypothetical protein